MLPKRRQAAAGGSGPGSSVADRGTGDPEAGRGGLALPLLCSASFVVVLDTGIVTVALPTIGRDLGISTGGLQWVLVSYSLVFGGLLMLGGRAGDLFGRRRVFLIGFALLALASVAGALAVAPWMLLSARVAQGTGAALAAPASLSLVTSIFEQGRERDRAVSLYSAMAALGSIAGVVLGGVVTQLLGWRWVMVAALPVALPVLLLTPSTVAEHRAPDRPGGLDPWGALTATLGLVSLLFALSGAGERGWSSPATLGLLAIGAALLAGFVAVERRSRAPLVPLPVLRRPRVAAPNAAILLTAATGASTYLLTLYLQRALGRSPLEAGLCLLPLSVVAAAAAPVTGWLVGRRAGPRATMTVGMAVQAAGLLLMALMSVGNLAVVLAGSVVWAVGKVLADVSITITATAGVGEDHRGLGAGLVTTAQEVGRALGLGALTAVAAARTEALAGSMGEVEALLGGFRWGLRAGVAFLAAALLVALVGLSGRRRVVRVGSG
jgi:EmrB/QacA subfamily drug resistance transporter